MSTKLSLVPEPPRQMHQPWHMAGWEAFGVVGQPPKVRRLGVGHDGKGKPGTEKWHKGEAHNGVGSIEIHTHGDHPVGAYIYVVGPVQAKVAAAWQRAEAAFLAVQSQLWE